MLMYIMHRRRNILNRDCDMFFCYNVNCRLTVLIDGSWSIGDLENKVLQSRRCGP